MKEAQAEQQLLESCRLLTVVEEGQITDWVIQVALQQVGTQALHTHTQSKMTHKHVAMAVLWNICQAKTLACRPHTHTHTHTECNDSRTHCSGNALAHFGSKQSHKPRLNGDVFDHLSLAWISKRWYVCEPFVSQITHARRLQHTYLAKQAGHAAKCDTMVSDIP